MRISIPVFAGTIAVSLIGGAAAPIAYTQSQPPTGTPTVYVVAFMKVDPQKIPDYLRLEREVWKPVHQERIRTGRMRSWSLYRVRYPYGAASEYNYATVNGYASLADDDRSIEDVFRKIHSSASPDQLGKRTYETRSLVRGEVWERLEHVE